MGVVGDRQYEAPLQQSLARLALLEGHAGAARERLALAMRAALGREQRSSQLSIIGTSAEVLAAEGEQELAAAWWIFAGAQPGIEAVERRELARRIGQLALDDAARKRARITASALSLAELATGIAAGRMGPLTA
jgi:hypothetical protein